MVEPTETETRRRSTRSPTAIAAILREAARGPRDRAQRALHDAGAAPGRGRRGQAAGDPPGAVSGARDALAYLAPCASSPASSPPDASTWATTSARSRQYVAGQERGEALFCIVDLHAITVPYEPAELREQPVRPDRAAARRRPRPRALHPLPPERRARAHRAVLAALQRHRARAPAAHAPVPRQVAGAARAGLGGPAPLPGAAGRRRARLPRARGARRRGPARAPRADARRRAALQRALRRRRGGAGRARAPHPRRSARASWTCRTRRARCRRPAAASRAPSTCSTSRAAIEKKFKSAVTDSGSEIRRGPEKPGVTNLIEILAAVRGVTPEAIEAEFAERALRRVQGGRRRGGGRVPRAGARALRAAARRRGRRSRTILAGGAERARAIAAQTLADVRERMGVGRRARARQRQRQRRAVERARRGSHRASLRSRDASPPRARPRGLQRPVRPAADAGAARGGRPARAAARRRRARLPRPPRGPRRARPGDRHRVHRARSPRCWS